jgi:hypothetical protein
MVSPEKPAPIIRKSNILDKIYGKFLDKINENNEIGGREEAVTGGE